MTATDHRPPCSSKGCFADGRPCEGCVIEREAVFEFVEMAEQIEGEKSWFGCRRHQCPRHVFARARGEYGSEDSQKFWKNLR